MIFQDPGPGLAYLENRRPLPDLLNGSHILDGPDQRLFLGFIDIFTLYGRRQRVVRALKTALYCGSTEVPDGSDTKKNRTQMRISF